MNPENVNCSEAKNSVCNKSDTNPNSNENLELSPVKNQKETDKNLVLNNKDDLNLASVAIKEGNIWNILRNLNRYIRNRTQIMRLTQKAKSDKNPVLRNKIQLKQAFISKNKINIKIFFRNLIKNKRVSIEQNKTKQKAKHEETLESEKENVEKISKKVDILGKEKGLIINTETSNSAQLNNTDMNKLDGSPTANEKIESSPIDNKKETDKNRAVGNTYDSKQASALESKRNITNSFWNPIRHIRARIKHIKLKPKANEETLKLEKENLEKISKKMDILSKENSLKIKPETLSSTQENNIDITKIDGIPNANEKIELSPIDKKIESNKNILLDNKDESKKNSVPKDKMNITNRFRNLIRHIQARIKHKKLKQKVNEETLESEKENIEGISKNKDILSKENSLKVNPENLNSAQANNTDKNKLDGSPNATEKIELSPIDNKIETNKNLVADNKDESKRDTDPKDKMNVTDRLRNLIKHIRTIIKNAEDERKAKKEAYKLEKENLKNIPKELDESHKEKRYCPEREWFIDQYRKYIVCLPRVVDRPNPTFILGLLRLKSFLRYVPEQSKPWLRLKEKPPTSTYLAWKGATIQNCRCPLRECFCRGDMALGKKRIPCETRIYLGLGYLCQGLTCCRRVPGRNPFIDKIQTQLNHEMERYQKLYDSGILQKMAPELCLLSCQHLKNPGKYRTIQFLPQGTQPSDKRLDDEEESKEEEKEEEEEEEEDIIEPICNAVSCTVGLQVNTGNDGEVIYGKISHVLYPSIKDAFVSNIEGQRLQISTYEREDTVISDNQERIRTMEKLLSLKEIKCRISKFISSIYVIKDPGVPVTTRATQLPCCRNACKDIETDKSTNEYSCGDKDYGSIPEVPWSESIRQSIIKDDDDVDDKDQGSCICCKLYKEQFSLDMDEDVPEKLKNEILRDVIEESYLENNQEIPPKVPQNLKTIHDEGTKELADIKKECNINDTTKSLAGSFENVENKTTKK